VYIVNVSFETVCKFLLFGYFYDLGDIKFMWIRSI